MTTTTQDGFAAWQAANGEIVTEFINGRECIPLEALAMHQTADDPTPFECVRCGDSVSREDVGTASEGPVCPGCAEWVIRHHGKVSYR